MDFSADPDLPFCWGELHQLEALSSCRLLAESVSEIIGADPQSPKNLPGEVTLTAFLAPEQDTSGSLIQEDVQKLLEEYKYRSGGKVKVEQVQPYLDFQAAQNWPRSLSLRVMRM